MKLDKAPFYITTFFVIQALVFSPSVFADWFITKNLYTTAHKYLLDGKTADAFQTIIQAWQQPTSTAQRQNLNDLLETAIGEDCGHTLEKNILPSWLSKLSIQREIIQHLSHREIKIIISGETKNKINQINLSNLSDRLLVKGKPIIEQDRNFSITSKLQKNILPAGLYKLSISAVGQKTWTQWIVFTTPPEKQEISWKNSRTWRIEAQTLSHINCPSLALSINIYGLNNQKWKPIWSKTYNDNFPQTLKDIAIPNGNYWLAIGLIKTRWQGQISIVDIQKITRSFNFSTD